MDLKKRPLITVIALLICGNLWAKNSIILVGKVPGKYLGSSETKSYVAKIKIEDSVITEITPIRKATFAETGIPVLHVKSKNKYDIIYPGLIDLHGHNKSNMFPIWDMAKGQFNNRFEWRGYGGYAGYPDYKRTISKNANPWVNFGDPSWCAAYRWTELQSMTLGTTYLQGHSICADGYGIHRVESPDAFITNKTPVMGPTDLILPDAFVFIWKTIKPKMEEMKKDGKNPTYKEVFTKILFEYCPNLKNKITDVFGKKELRLLKNQKILKKECGIQTKEDMKNFPEGFIRYVYYHHPDVAKRTTRLNAPNRSAYLVHLAEGRRNDKYNKLEFEIMKLVGLARENVNVVHGVGIDHKGYKEMAKRKMGLVWSPFSNLMLYGETADILSARKAGVTVALGSDWVPTGTRSVLDELKIAKRYILEDPDRKQTPSLPSLKKHFGRNLDKELYKMVTENPAKLINHWDIDIKNREHGIGRLAVGAMGSVIVVRENKKNPYSNLIDATDNDIKLVIVDGNPIYGVEKFVKDYQNKIDRKISYEQISGLYFPAEQISGISPDEPPSWKSDQENKNAHMIHLGKLSKKLKLAKIENGCNFKEDEKRVLVHESQTPANEIVNNFMIDSGLNLDNYADILKYLGLSMLNQTRNHWYGTGSDKPFATTYVPPLFGCDDKAYLDRINKFIDPDSDNDELTDIINGRKERREAFRWNHIAEKMAKEYGL